MTLRDKFWSKEESFSRILLQLHNTYKQKKYYKRLLYLLEFTLAGGKDLKHLELNNDWAQYGIFYVNFLFFPVSLVSKYNDVTSIVNWWYKTP